MKGVPLRLEIGLRDIQNGKLTIARRDSDQKVVIDKSNIVKRVPELLDEIQSALFNQALEFRSLNTHTAKDYDEFKNIIKNNGGFVRCGWDGSEKTEKAIKDEGILEILNDAGFELREPGCSACLAMNDDKIPPGKYAVSTSNRNFEGRQGPGSRTILASPLVAAAAAVTGKISDPRKFL